MRDWNHCRNFIACAICNWVLNHVATKPYRDMIGGTA